MSEIYRADQIDQVLVDAINTKNYESVREILENCDDNFNILDINSKYGMTAFHHAVQRSVADIDIIKLLIDHANQCAIANIPDASEAHKFVAKFYYIDPIINKKTRNDEYGSTAVDIVISTLWGDGRYWDISKLLLSVGGRTEEYKESGNFNGIYFNDDQLINTKINEDGSSYTGHFYNGEEKHGSGTMTFPDGSSFSGVWEYDHIYSAFLNTVAYG